VNSRTFQFAKLPSFVNDVKETRFLGEVIVDKIDKAVVVNHLVDETTGLGVLRIQHSPLLPPQLKCLILTHINTTFTANGNNK